MKTTIVGRGLMRYLIYIFKILAEAVRSFFDDGCPNLSAAVAFYFLISLIPVLFLIIFASSLILGSSESAYGAVTGLIKDLHPYMEEKLLSEIKRLSGITGHVGWLSLGFLLWASSMFFSSLETAFTAIFKVTKKRRKFKSLFMSVAIIPIGLCSILFFLAVTTLTEYITHWELGGMLAHSALIRYVIPLSVTILFFTMIYRFIPNRSVPFIHAFIGGIVCAVMLEIARDLFLMYLSRGGSPAGFVYGSLKAMIYAALWVFYIASITLFSGEIVSILVRRKDQQEG